MDLGEFSFAGVDTISFAAARSAGVAFDGEQVLTLNAAHEADVADALEVGVVDAEDVPWKWGARRLTGRPYPIRGSGECGAPRTPGVLHPTSIQVVAHECCAPWVALAEADVGEVALHRRSVIAACGFAYAHVGHRGIDNTRANKG